MYFLTRYLEYEIYVQSILRMQIIIQLSVVFKCGAEILRSALIQELYVIEKVSILNLLR